MSPLRAMSWPEGALDCSGRRKELPGTVCHPIPPTDCPEPAASPWSYWALTASQAAGSCLKSELVSSTETRFL